MAGLLSIGRFSQVARLSVRTLRRYAEQGLLVPALVDEATGRRYYSPAQAADAELIRLLRALDVPLEDVRALLGEADPAAAASRLAVHRTRLAEQLAHQTAVLSELDALLARPEPLASWPVTLRLLPEQIVVATRSATTLAGLPAAFGAAFGLIEGHLHRVCAQRAGPPLAIYHGEEFDPDALDVEVAVPVAGWVPVGEGVDVRVLPAQQAATTVHRGRYDRIGAAYRSIAAWAAGTGNGLGVDAREVYVVGPDRADPAGERLRTEVAWPLGAGPPSAWPPLVGTV